MKKYLLFLFDCYDQGNYGWDAFEGDFDNIKSARKKASEDSIWGDYQIIDSEKKMIIERGYTKDL